MVRDGRWSIKSAPPGLERQYFRYCQHRDNTAKRDGIEFNLTFDEWWNIWQQSGHWEQRGRGSEKYCMCRKGDVGPYSAENVFIATNAENVAAIARAKTLPIGVRTQRGKFYATRCIRNVSYHIGTFATPELAREAYLNFSVA